MPSQWGSYRSLMHIGTGGAGMTFLVVNDAASSPMLLCLKQPHPRHDNDPTYLETFETEAECAKLLQHPHIVPVFEVNHARGVPFIVYPYIGGLDLAELLRGVSGQGQQLAWDLVAWVATQIASALEYAHRSVIHRDVCPSNILIGVSGVASLTDFGIAKAIEDCSLMPSLLGTGRVAYSAPERLMSGGGYDRRADLFSLGVCLFEALTNRKPFDSGFVEGHLEQVLHGPPPRVETLRAEFQPDYEGEPDRGLIRLVAIVHRLLSPNPNDRFASAGDVVDALSEIIVPPGGHRALAAEVERHMPPWRRHIRQRTGPTPARDPEEHGRWSRTDPDRLAYLLDDDYDETRDGACLYSDAEPDPFETTLPDRPAFDAQELSSTQVGPWQSAAPPEQEPSATHARAPHHERAHVRLGLPVPDGPRSATPNSSRNAEPAHHRTAATGFVILAGASLFILATIDRLWVPLLTGNIGWTVIDGFWTPLFTWMGLIGAAVGILGRTTVAILRRRRRAHARTNGRRLDETEDATTTNSAR